MVSELLQVAVDFRQHTTGKMWIQIKLFKPVCSIINTFTSGLHLVIYTFSSVTRIDALIEKLYNTAKIRRNSKRGTLYQTFGKMKTKDLMIRKG
jgi:hypothetical protein